MSVYLGPRRRRRWYHRRSYALLKPTSYIDQTLESEITIPSLPVPEFPIRKFNEPFFITCADDNKVWVITSKYEKRILSIYKYCDNSEEIKRVTSMYAQPNYWILFSNYLQKLIVMVRCPGIGNENNYYLVLVDIHSGVTTEVTNCKITFPGRVKRKYMRIMEINGYLYIFYVHQHAIFNYQIKMNFFSLLHEPNSTFIGMLNIDKSYILSLYNQFNICIEYCHITKMFVVFVFYKWGGHVYFLKTKGDKLQDAIQVNTIKSDMSMHGNTHKSLYYKHGFILIISKNHPMVYYHVKENKWYPTKYLFPNFNLAKVHITTAKKKIMLFRINTSKCLEIRNFGTASSHGTRTLKKLLNDAAEKDARHVIWCIIKSYQKHYNLDVPMALLFLILRFYLDEKW